MKKDVAENDFKELLEIAKKDKRVMIKLKELLVVAGQYGLAAEIRSMQEKYHPISKADALEISKGKKIKTLLGMVRINTDERSAWLIYNTIVSYQKKKGKFAVSDAVELELKAERLFL